MKPIWKRTAGLFVLLALILPLLPVNSYASSAIVTTPTGYTQASDVDYIIRDGTVVNWGARGEDCVFLTTYAEDFYTGSYTYDALSALSGSSNQSSVPGSDLYKALQTLMKSNHTNIQSYHATRAYYQYTDCVSNDYSKISSFYSGKMVNSKWNGQTYNREHTWPNSKGLNGNDENDIMMLRPTVKSENSDRGNTAYGESSGYYDPGESVRGDCARIVLYVYVRWGNTGNMWHSSGVIENLDILLKWMEEDPVDTWEMARNDSVQSITGTRNVFIDYPELAFLMFGREIPADMSTPSGGAQNGGSGNHGGSNSGGNSGGSSTQPSAPCAHANVDIHGYKAPTCTQDGYSGDKYCADCQASLGEGAVIPRLKHDEELQRVKEPSCGEAGFTGDLICSVCGKLLEEGQPLPATGDHNFGPWKTVQEATASENGLQERTCTVCGHKETAQIPYSGGNSEPSDPTESTEPSEPTEPSKPTEPSQSTEPSEPVQSTEPSEPVQPTEPSESTEPSQSTKPSKPTEPSQSTEPSEPAQSTEPSEPAGDKAPANAEPAPIIMIEAAIAGCAVIVTIVMVWKKRK